MSNETANMDFKYVLQDFNNVYIGARLTFAELCEQDDTPQLALYCRISICDTGSGRRDTDL